MPFSQGSSPLARGLQHYYYYSGERHGIIPARAGFTPTRSAGRERPGDHPRSRGVYQSVPCTGLEPGGSSPLARGLRDAVPHPRDRRGIIPARAGFTRVRDARHRPPADHPRSRGVYPPHTGRRADQEGSSPLARGLRRLPQRVLHGRRIIPARAGFTTPHSPASPTSSDHPRSRGVYVLIRCGPACRPGSSPLARGLHLRILGIPTNPHSTRPLPPSLPT